MTVRSFTLGGTLSNNATAPVQQGYVVVHVGGDTWLPWADGQAYVGGQLGVITWQGPVYPGGQLTVQTAGPVPNDIYNLGAGLATFVVASGVPARGTSGQPNTIGMCDTSGLITILPTRLGDVGQFQGWGADLANSAATQQYVSSLSYNAAGFAHGAVSPIAVNGTGAALNWVDGAAVLQKGGTSVLHLGDATTTNDFITLGGDRTISSVLLGGVTHALGINKILVPTTDVVSALGTSSFRFAGVLTNNTGFLCVGAAGDLAATAAYTGSSLSYGVGGSSGRDVKLARTAAATLTLDDNAGGAATLRSPGLFINGIAGITFQFNGVNRFAITSAGPDAQTNQIHNVVDPTAAQDAATKHYVDNAVALTLAGDVTGATSANTVVKLTGSSGTVTIAAGTSLSGTAGAGGLALGSMTGNTSLPTGTLSWSGASGKAGNLQSLAAALTITAGAASTWSTLSGALAITSASGLTLTGAGASTWSTSSGNLAITSASALTLTAAAASTWSTSAGNLSIDSAATLNLGASTATAVQLGTTATGTTAIAGATCTMVGDSVQIRAAVSNLKLDPSGSGSLLQVTRLWVSSGGAGEATFAANLVNGGNCPTTTAQWGWLKVQDNASADKWIPVWV